MLAFISGPHGAGKTTFLSRLRGKSPLIETPELVTDSPKFDISPLERQLLKACKRAIENYEIRCYAEKAPEKLIIGNRCIYDQHAYIRTFFSLGWLTKEQMEEALHLTNKIFIEELREPYAIVLNPGFDKTRERLEQRWKTKKKKWNEENMDYLHEACRAYEAYANNEKILYLTDNEEKDAERTVEWFREIKEKEKNLEKIILPSQIPFSIHSPQQSLYR